MGKQGMTANDSPFKSDHENIFTDANTQFFSSMITRASPTNN